MAQDDLAKLLFQCRVDRMLTLEKVAEAIGVSRQSVSQIEKGLAKGRRTTRFRLAEFLRKHGYYPKTEIAA